MELACRRLKIAFLFFFYGLCVIMSCTFMHGKGGDLLIRLSAVITVVGFAGCMNHMVLVQAGVLCEAFVTARYSANVRLLSWK